MKSATVTAPGRNLLYPCLREHDHGRAVARDRGRPMTTWAVETPEDARLARRYLNDATWHYVVHQLAGAIEQGGMTPSDLHDAVDLAARLVRERAAHPPPDTSEAP